MSKAIARKKIAVHPEEAEVVRLIYQWYLEGQGGKAIAQRLNAEGKLYRGRPWLKDRIFDIIGDESYVGRYYFNKRDHKTHRPKPKEEWVLMQVEPIVDQVTWERAKALKEERDPTKGANPAAVASKTLLTGLAVCGLCGARMTLETSRGGRRFTYYNCSNYIRRGKAVCPGQRIPARELEQAVLDHMANKLFTAERVKAILKGVYEVVRKLEKGNDAQRKSLNRQLDVIKAKLGKQYEAIESGAVDCIALCRPLIREPDLIRRWRSGDTRAADCLSCGACMKTDKAIRSEIPRGKSDEDGTSQIRCRQLRPEA